MRRVNSYLFLTSLLLIVLGVICMINPGESFVSMAWLIGLLIMLSGCFSLLFGLKAQRYLPNAGSTTLLAIFQIVIGLLFLCNSMLAAGTLVVMFAMWVMFEGISLSVLSFDYKRSNYAQWWVMLLLGVCSVLLGVLALAKPVGTGVLLGILLGLGIFANGVVRLVAYTGLRHIGSRLRDIKESATAHNNDDAQAQ